MKSLFINNSGIQHAGLPPGIKDGSGLVAIVGIAANGEAYSLFPAQVIQYFAPNGATIGGVTLQNGQVIPASGSGTFVAGGGGGSLATVTVNSVEGILTLPVSIYTSVDPQSSIQLEFINNYITTGTAILFTLSTENDQAGGGGLPVLYNYHAISGVTSIILGNADANNSIGNSDVKIAFKLINPHV